jgi:glutaredoxin
MTLQTNLKVAALLLLCAGAASAQMYKWKDAAGVTHFSDTPPPAAAKVEARSFSGNAGGDVSTAGMPYELAQAVKNFPVTLYTTAGCGACDQARAMLNQRGVPFTEKTVTGNADQAAFRKAGGGNELPMMLVGRSKLVGYDSGTWGGALTSASYPAQRALPANYQNARVTTAAPQVQAQPVGDQGDGAAAAAAVQNALRDKPAPVNAPPGFQF